MIRKYIFSIFVLCFFAWAVIVDNATLPSNGPLRQDVGVYTQYRVKIWQKGGKLDVIPDELMIYATVGTPSTTRFQRRSLNVCRELVSKSPRI